MLDGFIILGFLGMVALGYPMWQNIKNVLHPLHSLRKLTADDSRAIKATSELSGIGLAHGQATNAR